MYKFDAVPIDPEEIKRRYMAMQKLQPAPGPELRGPGITLPPTMPPGTPGLPIPTPDPLGPPPPGGHSTRRMAGGILDAVGQAFQPPEQSMPVPQMPTDNEAQRQARIAALRLPGYRYGGNAKKDKPIIVGDGAGPEVFVPKTDGVVIPNIDDQRYNGPPLPTQPIGLQGPGYTSPVANTAPQIQLPQVNAPVTPPMNEVPKSPPVVANVPVPESTLPAVTAPANSGSGWDSDTQAMKDQREYDRTRPATLPEAEGEYNRILTNKEHPNKFLSGLFLALQGISHIYGDQTPIKSLADARRDRKLDEQGRVVKTLEDQAKFDTDIAYRKAQKKNLEDDNIRQEAERVDKATKYKDDLNFKRRVAFRKNHPYFSPDKATEADKKELASFGETPETMGTYDFSKPDVHTVAGVTYRYNPNAQSYEDSGIPHDGSKALTEYTVKDADGVTYRYTTTNEKAAGLKTQLVAAGLQIEGAKERQASQQTFTAGENQKNRQFQSTMAGAKAQFQIAMKQMGQADATKKAINAFVNAYTKKNGHPPTEEETAAYVSAIITPDDTPEP